MDVHLSSTGLLCLPLLCLEAEAGLAQLTAEAAQLASEVSEAVDAQACSLLRGGCRTLSHAVARGFGVHAVCTVCAGKLPKLVLGT